jgi:hypothetical protein
MTTYQDELKWRRRRYLRDCMLCRWGSLRHCDFALSYPHLGIAERWDLLRRRERVERWYPFRDRSGDVNLRPHPPTIPGLFRINLSVAGQACFRMPWRPVSGRCWAPSLGLRSPGELASKAGNRVEPDLDQGRFNRPGLFRPIRTEPTTIMQPAKPLRDSNLNNRDTEQHRRTDHDRFDCDPFQAAYPTVAAPNNRRHRLRNATDGAPHPTTQAPDRGRASPAGQTWNSHAPNCRQDNQIVRLLRGPRSNGI